MDPNLIAAALARAGVDRLPLPSRVYLSGRLTSQFASGAVDPATNLGALRNLTFGEAGQGFARFADVDAASRALVSTSYRAAPRDWSKVDAAELGRLGTYPLSPKGEASAGPPAWLPVSGVERTEVGEFKWSYLIPGYGPYQVAKDVVFGPSDEAKETFRGLVADWEGFDRLKVGDELFGPNDPLTPKPGEPARADGVLRSHPNLREQVVEWRKFRDAWKAGDIPGNELAAQLNVQRGVANTVRKYLAEAAVIDPALVDNKFDKPGVDVEKSTTALAKSTEVNTWARDVPVLNWMTNPAQSTVELPFIGAVPSRVLMVAGGGFAAMLLVMLARGRGATKVILSAPVPG